MNDPITILVVDDHEIVRRGIISLLDTQADIAVTGEAGSGDEAAKAAEEEAPDVVLMDLVMPGMDGVEATRRIKRISPRTQIIVLTSYHDDEHIFPAIQAGALSYLLKDIEADDLVEAIRKAARGEAVVHPRVAARLVREVHAIPDRSENPFVDLSPRELEVIDLIADGLDNAAIAERLFISTKTVKSHVSNILSKLHLADRTQAAVLAWRRGMKGRGDRVD